MTACLVDKENIACMEVYKPEIVRDFSTHFNYNSWTDPFTII